MKTIDDKILKAIREYLAYNRYGHKDLALKLGISPQAIQKWLDGSTKKVKDRVWPLLEPLISPYICVAKDFDINNDNSENQLSETRELNKIISDINNGGDELKKAFAKREIEKLKARLLNLREF